MAPTIVLGGLVAHGLSKHLVFDMLSTDMEGKAMDDPVRVSTTEFDKRVDHYQDLALTKAVVLTRDGHDSIVMISAADYDRLRRDRKVYAAGELPAELLEAVERAEVAPQHSHLDRMLDDWQP